MERQNDIHSGIVDNYDLICDIPKYLEISEIM